MTAAAPPALKKKGFFQTFKYQVEAGPEESIAFRGEGGAPAWDSTFHGLLPVAPKPGQKIRVVVEVTEEG
jgi:hypothetical protein